MDSNMTHLDYINYTSINITNLDYFNYTEYMSTNLSNTSNSSSVRLPPWLGFDDQARRDIIAYCVLFVVAAVGNLTVFITLLRAKNRKSRVNLMISHLAVADLIVALIMIP
ncbi:unnamed protein product, partial [Meganyctiphanes norvegica]